MARDLIGRGQRTRSHQSETSGDQSKRQIGKHVVHPLSTAKLAELSNTRFQKPIAQVFLRGARAAYVGPGLNLAPHRNAVATIALAQAVPFELAIAVEGRVLGKYQMLWAALIPPGSLHHLKAHGAMVFLYLDALSDDHRLVQRMRLEAFDQRAAAGLFAGAADGALEGLFDLVSATASAADPRVAKVVRQIDNAPERFATIGRAAAVAGLSASRFQALFRDAVGIPFRRYRLWRRMGLVMRILGRGGTLTHAAHAAGFNSSAHLSTAFKAMFGFAPSQLVELGVRFDLD